MKRAELKRAGFLKRNAKPLARKQWQPPRTPMRKANPEATAKRKKRQSKERNNDETREAKRVAWIKANGHCQECGGSFDLDDQFSPAAPEYDHTCYKKGRVAGIYVHRKCHHLREMLNHPTRHTNRRSAA